MEFPLKGKVALVAGATRGAGRGTAVALGEAGALVYCTGRTTNGRTSDYRRPETIDETAAMVSAAGGTGVAVAVDHLHATEVDALVRRIDGEHGRLDILVNDIWGGENLIQWNKPLWEHDLEGGCSAAVQACRGHNCPCAQLRRALPDAPQSEIKDSNSP
ncbi:SDR family NAD(P)-dependent oxidoreductase [Arthrobacter sp. NPDC056727]|uniref:SDR family NAD(P)-dependent oxidoreductase n=1 Tax=Arthrobacter sp. NPDC056727 TaxID=3345927 RepID=UPI00366E1491